MNKRNQIFNLPIVKIGRSFKVGCRRFSTYDEADKEKSYCYFQEVKINHMKYLSNGNFYCKVKNKMEIERYIEGMQQSFTSKDKLVVLDKIDEIKFPCYLFENDYFITIGEIN